ncbi:hypothetical protein ZIOFF_023290 [Zingiber officinale]|uniref:Uncharacterized protein n=1 Tax=Zingiber officinale TaxID=94328 RepID=A0A8J5LHT6_ZINOF|nr:hypothetical protein ZIOFF_023290 [Zingiber officinale]
MGEGAGFQLGTVGALSLSVVSSVSIVICNKALMSSLGFQFACDMTVATTLTSWHLLVTFCSLHVALCMKLFEHKPFDRKVVMGFGVLNGISIGLLNLSLGFNSVGFYQMTKLAIIPCTVFLETAFFAKKFSLRQLQYISCNWEDIASDIPSSGASQNLPGFDFWLCQQKAREATAQMLQGKDNESDPLMRAEVGAGVNSDGSPPISQVWSSNKDLRA